MESIHILDCYKNNLYYAGVYRMNTGIIKKLILLINIFLLVSCGGGGKKNNTDPTDPGQNKASARRPLPAF